MRPATVLFVLLVLVAFLLVFATHGPSTSSLLPSLATQTDSHDHNHNNDHHHDHSHPDPDKPNDHGEERVAVLVSSTGKYSDLFLLDQIRAILAHWHSSPHVNVFVWSDLPPDRLKGLGQGHVTLFPHQQNPWPVSTYERPELFLKEAERFAAYDYIFTIDADLMPVAEIGPEINGELVGLRHPGYLHSSDNQKELPYDRNPLSTAYIDENSPDQKGTYYQGCFYGGKTGRVIELWKALEANIKKDLEKNIIARFHEESHLNRYFRDHPPTKAVGPSYAYPESWNLPGERRIILHLDKGKHGGHSSFQT